MPHQRMIKIYGLQRSGTNYMTFLLNQNFKNLKVLVNIGGWKHGFYTAVWTLGGEVDIVILTKNPYAWLRSVYEYWGPNRRLNVGPDLRDVSFSDFLQSRAIFERQKGVPFLIRAANPVQYWNNMNFHYYSIMLEQRKKALINYEELLDNPQDVLNVVGDHFEWELDGSFVGSEKEFVPSGEDVLQDSKEFTRQNYYANKEYLAHYTPSLLEFVNSELDREVMEVIGYGVESK